MKRTVSAPDFQALFQCAPGLYLVLVPDLTIVAVSDAYLRATLTRREEILGRGLFEVFPDNPDDPAADGVRNLRASLERVLEHRAPDKMATQKYDIRRPQEEGGDFEVRYWSPLNSPVLDAAGDVTYIIHQVEDVTELVQLQRKGIEQEEAARVLQESREWFSTTLGSIADAVIATDADNRIILMNPAAEALTGWTGAEARGRAAPEVFQIVDEATGSAVRPVLAAMGQGRPVTLPETSALIAKTGRRVPVEDTAAPIRDDRGQIIGGVVVFRDVSEKRTAQRALRDGEERFRTLAESIPHLAWMANPDGHIFWYNKRWYDYTGTTLTQMQGWGWQSVHDPGELPMVVERWKASLGSGVPFDMVFPLRGSDGRFRPFLTRVMPFRDADGRIVLWFGTNTDITERVEMETALKESNRRKDEFLAMLAHELRNPLSSIGNAVRLLTISGPPDPDLVWGRDVIDRQVKHLARLVDDLLDVSRITRGKIQLRKERIDAAAVLSSAVDAIRPLIDEKKQELYLSFVPGTLWCEVDPLRLEQVIANLLTNATKYTEAGGTITLSARHEGDRIIVKVRDTGVGIAPEKLPQMFELFAQGDHPLARSDGGLGIGLTIVKSLVEMHGGTIEAFSGGHGMGSQFTVTLPAVPQPGREPARVVMPPRPMAKGSRLLVVDDNVDTATGLAKLLKLLDHDVQVAYDGPSALETARSHRPEFVLLDIGLPGMDGYAVAERLRAEAVCKDSVLIAITGYGQEEARRRSREAGFNHHLVKPVDYDALVSLIHQAR